MRRKIFMIVSFLATFLVMDSCLKDDVGLYWTDDLEGKMYAEVWRSGFQALGLAPVPDPVTFKFLVNIASDQPPAEDIVITLAVDTSAMGRYNRLKKTNYMLYPYIQILDENLTIKAGTRNAYAHVKVWNAHLLNACDNFMAPIVIQSATGGVIPADPLNNGARLMALPISNPYAGDYHTVGYRKHPSYADPLTVDDIQTASTVDCKTIIKSGFGDYPYDVKIEVTSNTITVLGVTCYKIKVPVIDPGTGSPVDGQGMYDTFTGAATSPPIPPSNDVNYYNPVTKTFVWNAFYNTAAPRIAYEIMTRL